MKQTFKRSVVAGAALVMLASPAVALAHDGVSGGDDDGVVHAEMESTSPSPSSTPRADRQGKFETELRDQLEQRSKERQASLANKVSDLRQRLDAAKKKACENHVTTINKLMTVMNKRRDNALGTITKILTAVQAFKDKKQLDVANYDDLVAKANAAKSVAEAATLAQQQIPSLNCSGDHPRADVADFKDKRSTSIDAVKAYRDAVKDVVKAVKAAAEAAKATASPSPTATPEGGDQ